MAGELFWPFLLPQNLLNLDKVRVGVKHLSQKKKINVQSLVNEIEKLTKKNIAKKDVVSLEEYRRIKREQKEPFHVLFIEDDEIFRTGIVRFLESEGYRVTAAVDGTQLDSVLGDDPIDLILLDVGLPWVNGYELAEILKQHDDLKSIPLVFLSGASTDLDVQRAKSLGADDYFTKPVELPKLKERFEELL